MAPSKRQKLDRESNAAYAASQPLFDALRAGATKVDEQRIHLLKARDTVQQLHVKLADINDDDAQKHELYMEATVKAWRSATESFSNIFEELCKISAPDASAGKDAGEHHGQFALLAQTAAAAQKAAMSYSPGAGKGRITPVKPGKRTRVEEDAGRAQGKQVPQQAKKPRTEEPAPAPSTVTQSPKRPSPELVEENGGTAEAARPAKAQEMSEDIATAEQAARKVEKARLRREGRKQKRQNKLNSGAAPTTSVHEKAHDTPAFGADYVPLDGGHEPSPASAGKENTVPQVEYEDVSAEVTARLKAKEERKKAKKEEKKRKRESGDSALVEATVVAAVERPSKKKLKADSAVPAADASKTENVIKRKQAGQEDVAEGGAKKRRKGKA